MADSKGINELFSRFSWRVRSEPDTKETILGLIRERLIKFTHEKSYRACGFSRLCG